MLAGLCGRSIFLVALLSALSIASGADASTGTTVPLDVAGTSTAVTGPALAIAKAVRVSPPTTAANVPSSGSSSCPTTVHGAVIDRANQRAWLCTSGVAAAKFPITTAISQPNPGTYHVFAKDRLTTSTFGGHLSYLDNFVAFTYGTNTGARVAFHAVPRDAAGNPYQPYDTVGTAAWFGQSSGCIRALPEQSQVIWDHLAIGDAVVVIS